jgi:hypothetical protein
MRVHPARAAPPLKPDDRIAPHQLWSHLSVGQQQHVRQVLIGVAQQLLAHRPSQPRTEEATHHDPRSQSGSRTCILRVNPVPHKTRENVPLHHLCEGALPW